MIIAQVTDVHAMPPGRRLRGGYEPAPALATVRDRVAAMRPRPDLVVFTGDLTDAGTEEEYAAFLAGIAALDLPMAAIPGNHDRRTAFADALPEAGIETGAGRFLHFGRDLGPLRLLLLDTVEEGASGGRLCADRLAWIGAELDAAAGRPAVIFMHHPPFPVGIPFMDPIGCAGGPELAALVARAGNVAGIACGHVHRPVAVRFGGTAATIAPAVCHAVPLDLAADARPRLEPQRPGFALHLWTPEAGLVSHSEYPVPAA